jgi:hypothetical protein
MQKFSFLKMKTANSNWRPKFLMIWSLSEARRLPKPCNFLTGIGQSRSEALAKDGSRIKTFANF